MLLHITFFQSLTYSCPREGATYDVLLSARGLDGPRRRLIVGGHTIRHVQLQCLEDISNTRYQYCNNIYTVQLSRGPRLSQYSSLTNKCKINVVYYIIMYINVQLLTSELWCIMQYGHSCYNISKLMYKVIYIIMNNNILNGN